MKLPRPTTLFLIVSVLLMTESVFADPLGFAFTYQGQLKQNGQPVSGTASMEFRLFDAATGGTQVGSTITIPSQSVANGLFTSTLDFGATPFATGQARWVDIRVNGSPLTPRQSLTSSPFSLGTRGINVDAAGQVGIGTASPSTTLHIVRPNGAACTWGEGNLALSGDENDGFLLMGVKDAGGAFLQSHGPSGRPLSLNPCGDSVVIGNTLNPTKRFVVGTTQMNIDRMPGLSEAIVLGSHYSDPGTNAALVFETNSRTAGGILVEKLGAGSNEDHRMNLMVTREGDPACRTIMSLVGNGRVGIGTISPQSILDVIGTTRTNALEVTSQTDLNAPTLRLRHEGQHGPTGAQKFRLDAAYPHPSGWNSGPRISLLYLTGDSIAMAVSDTGSSLGKVGIGTINPQTTLDVNGTTRTKVLQITGGSDVAEPFLVSGGNKKSVQPGMVVAIDPDHGGRLRLACEPYDRKVAGIISGANGINPGLTL